MEIKHRLPEAGRIVSLYTGAGGLDIGFHFAGFDAVWANDIDKYAISTYQDYFPNKAATVGNLLSVEIPKIKDLDLVIGGPPCQGFSVAGNMDPNDPRSKHVWNFLATVGKLKPRAFVMENVKALGVNSRWKELRDALKKESRKMGYEPHLFILNAANFGVPQARERMFLIGIKEGKIEEPKPISKKQTSSLRKTLTSLPEYGTIGNDSICSAKITLAKNPILRRSPYAGMLFNGQGRPLNLDMPALTLPASMGGNRTPIIDQRNLKNPKANPWVESYHDHLLNGGKPDKQIPNYLRRLTVEEAAAIQTFPREMKFRGTSTSQYRQIGNAVPPLLAYHVALALRKSLNY